MTVSSLLQDYAAFNLWANTEIINWLKTKPVELMDSEMPSSFPSITLTLLHVWGAEDIWLKRLRGIHPTVFLSSTFQGTTEEVFDGLLKCSEAFSDYVQTLSDNNLDEICNFRLLNGTEDSRPLAYMIHHCMNHSTYHRGQVITMARSLGLTDPPSTDFIKYIRAR